MTYPDDVRAAVIAAYLLGETASHLAQRHSIPRTTIIGWVNAAGLSKSSMSDTKKKALEEKIAGYVSEGFETLRIQAEIFRDATYLKKQPAGEAAVLHGVLADKLIRILEAANASYNESAERQGE